MTNTPHYSITERGFWSCYLVTLRPYLMPISGSAGVCGLALVEDLDYGTFALGAVTFFFIYGFGQALTDVFQTDTDAISAPYRPLVRGKIQRRDVLLVSLVGLAGCGAIFLVINPWTLFPSSLAVVGLVLYTWFKRQWWGGPPWNAWIVATLPVIGVMFGGNVSTVAIDYPRGVSDETFQHWPVARMHGSGSNRPDESDFTGPT